MCRLPTPCGKHRTLWWFALVPASRLGSPQFNEDGVIFQAVDATVTPASRCMGNMGKLIGRGTCDGLAGGETGTTQDQPSVGTSIEREHLEQTRGSVQGPKTAAKKRSRSTLDSSLDDPEMEGSDSFKVARRVYVGNLAWKTSWQDLKDFFSTVGIVKYADVLREGGPGSRSKGCGIVEFDTPEQAVAAIQTLNHTDLDGRSIFIREDREDYELRNLDGPPAPGADRQQAFKRTKAAAVGPVSIGRRVYVGNLAPETSWKELKDHFKSSGHVLHADVLTDPDGKSKGCGIVELSTAAEALRAISHLSNSTLDGRQIMVREDREDPSVAARGARGPPMGGPSGVGGGMMGPPQDGAQVVLHGIPYRMAWQELKDLCRQAGNVVRANIASNPDGSSKGYGLVQFASPEDAAAAISILNGQVIEGRIITAKFDRFAGQ